MIKTSKANAITWGVSVDRQENNWRTELCSGGGRRDVKNSRRGLEKGGQEIAQQRLLRAQVRLRLRTDISFSSYMETIGDFDNNTIPLHS